jgi:hypothetical protein
MQFRSGRVGWLPVMAIVVVSTLVRAWAARGVEAPWIFPDEMTYALLGRSVWHSGSLPVLGGVTGGYSLLYPAVVGVPLSLLGPSSGLAVAQVVQAFAMSSVALIVFAWGRRVVAETWALAAAALAVCVPGLAYSGLLMTETLFYPLVTLALWALWRVLVQPSQARQAVFVGVTAVAVLTRVQALALLPAAVLAVALYCVFRRDVTVLRRSAPLLGLVVAAGIVAMGLSLRPGAGVFGVYSAATGGYDVGAAARDVFWHAGGLFVIVAGVPLIALGVLVTERVRGRESDTAAALVATACAWTVISVVQVGTFASRWVGHIAERDLLTVAPPLFLVFVLWLARGPPRPQPLTSVVASVVAVPAILLPVARFANQQAALDAFSFIPLWQLRESTSSGALEAAYPLAVGLVVVAAVLVPRRARVVLVVLVASTLLLPSIVSSHEIQRLADADRTWVFSTEQPRWIDRVVNGPVTYIYADTAFPKALWQTLYWNEAGDQVLQFEGTPSAGPVPTQPVATSVRGLVLNTDGRRISGGYVVAPSNIVLAGKGLASYGPATDMPGMTLWQADSPLRILWITSGFRANGDIFGTARITVPRCTQGHLSLTLLGKQGTPVQVSVNGRTALTVTPAPGTVWTGDVPAPANAHGTGACIYEIDSPGLIGTTTIEFVPD